MRAFISLSTGELFARPARPPEGEEAATVEALEAALKGTGGELRFVKDEARHITLRFFGELPEGLRGDVSKAVAEAARVAKPFPIASQGVGFFPNAQRPRVVWVGIEDPEHQIQPVYAALQKAIQPLGLGAAEEAFVPHITIARVTRASPGPALADAVDPFVHARFGATKAEGLEFIESTLSKGGPVYRRIALHKFGGK